MIVSVIIAVCFLVLLGIALFVFYGSGVRGRRSHDATVEHPHRHAP